MGKGPEPRQTVENHLFAEQVGVAHRAGVALDAHLRMGGEDPHDFGAGVEGQPRKNLRQGVVFRLPGDRRSPR